MTKERDTTVNLHKQLGAVALLCVLSVVTVCAQSKAIVFAIPADGLSASERAPVEAYLSKQMGREVKFVIPDSYNHMVAGLADGWIDFAILGGVNYVRAHAKIGVVPLVQRPTDLNFHSVFITGAGSSIHSLKDLKGKRFAFNDVYSTSGHVMPYLELKKAGIHQETDLQVRFSGSHPDTAQLVQAGVVDAGAMDELIYKSMIDSGKLDGDKVRVFYTSKAFVDWVYVSRKSVPETEQKKFSRALESLNDGKDNLVLGLLHAKQFIPASDDKYAVLRQIVRELKLLD
jgi:phosphonate transport system substrate-binding protein